MPDFLHHASIKVGETKRVDASARRNFIVGARMGEDSKSEAVKKAMQYAHHPMKSSSHKRRNDKNTTKK